MFGKLLALPLDATNSAEGNSTYRMFVLAGNSTWGLQKVKRKQRFNHLLVFWYKTWSGKNGSKERENENYRGDSCTKNRVRIDWEPEERITLEMNERRGHKSCQQLFCPVANQDTCRKIALESGVLNAWYTIFSSREHASFAWKKSTVKKLLTQLKQVVC